MEFKADIKADGTMNSAINEKLKTKYLERFDNYIEQNQERIDEARRVVDLNQAVLLVIDGNDDPKLKEAKESFNQVIDMTKTQIDNATIKIEAAKRLKQKLEDGKQLTVLDFLVDFDKVAGN